MPAAYSLLDPTHADFVMYQCVALPHMARSVLKACCHSFCDVNIFMSTLICYMSNI